jgi:hypothetical protein
MSHSQGGEVAKLITPLIVILTLLVLSIPVFAEQSPQEKIALLEARRTAFQWEYRYCAERMQSLQLAAEKLDAEIAVIKEQMKQHDKKELPEQQTEQEPN